MTYSEHELEFTFAKNLVTLGASLGTGSYDNVLQNDMFGRSPKSDPHQLEKLFQVSVVIWI